MTSLRSQAETEVRDALEGVMTALEGPPLPAELAVVPLRVYGDALRLGLEAPNRLRTWASEHGAAALDGVLRATLALVGGHIAARADVAAADPTTATRLRERDHAASVVHAVRRVWLPRPLSQLEAHAELVSRLGVVDDALAAVLSRAEVIALLGARAALGAAWAQPFSDGEHDEASADLVSAELRHALPSVTLVAGYVESGSFHKLVEEAAARDPEFAVGLDETITAMGTVGHAGWWARGWQKRTATERAAAAFAFRAPALAYAASSDDAGARAPIEHRLGALFEDSPVDGILFVGEREVTLQLDFEAGAVAVVELGSERHLPAEGEETCRVTVGRTTQPLRLTVRTSSGLEVSDEISFDAGDA